MCRQRPIRRQNFGVHPATTTTATAATTTTTTTTNLCYSEKFSDDFHVGNEFLVDFQRCFALFARHLEKLCCTPKTATCHLTGF